ncbi:MAG: hypothetical protein AABX33_04600 [Nanoarchaeota archaeon]
MSRILRRYTPIDYRAWTMGDLARKGINIKRLNLLNPKEIIVFNNAFPYNGGRNDPGQAELVTFFSIRLLGYLGGNRKIVVPAAILHDTGFYFDEPDAWKKLVKSSADLESEANRRPHQNRGLLIAGVVLKKSEYPEKYFAEIADIIGDHDTRKLPTTNNGRIVRAADLLWRVTYPNLQIYFGDAPAEDALIKLENSALKLAPPRELEGVEKAIGRMELVNTLFFKFRQDIHDLLRKNYGPELEKIKEFYR